MKKPTKAEFRQLLDRELTSWSNHTNDTDPKMKEQAIGRVGELTWLIKVWDGEERLICQ